ncbi:tetratricopeptide repeat protein [uncultured Allomuricauda sp.]|uniref:tetratricopeptide repeat protein n=1 Tax=Flagellimonas sp. W118 TaxID=3410791 RepID=UPI002615427A|nr:tetratricopeptide repeat protein [uncultured Allomuricauda sp.]
MAKKPTRKIIGKYLGWIFGAFPILSGLSDLKTWDDLLSYLSEKAGELFAIAELIGRVVHLVLYPWRTFKNFLFDIAPFDIPIEWYDPIFIGSFLIFTPFVFVMHKIVHAESLSLWSKFNEEVRPLFSKEPEKENFRTTHQEINKVLNPVKYKKLLGLLAGPPIEYFFLLISDVHSEIITNKREQCLKYFEQLDGHFQSLKVKAKKSFRKQRIRFIILLSFILIITIDRLFYVPGFRVLEFLKWTGIFSIALPVGVYYCFVMLGLAYILVLKFEKNPYRRAKIFDRLTNGAFGFKGQLLKSINDYPDLKDWLVIWGEKLTPGQAVMSIFPGEQEIAHKFTFQKNKKLGTSYLLGTNNYYYKLKMSQSVPVLVGSQQKTVLKLFPIRAKFKHEKRFNEYDWLLKGQYHYFRNEFDLSIKSLKQCLLVNPNFFLGHDLLSFIYAEAKDHDSSDFHLKKAIEINPISKNTYNRIGLNHMNMGNYELAIDVFDKMLRRNPASPNILINKGECHLKAKQFDLAKAEFNKAVDFMPKNSLALAKRGHANYFLGNYMESINDFGRALAIEPNNSLTIYFLSLCHYKLRNFKIALEFIDKAIALEPLQELLFSAKAIYLVDLDSFDGARESIQKALDINPNNPKSISISGFVEYHAEKFDNALQILNFCIERFPDFQDSYAFRSTVHLVMGDIEKGELDNNKCLELNPDSKRYFLNKGIINLKKGNKELACNNFKKAEEIGIYESKKWLREHCGIEKLS